MLLDNSYVTPIIPLSYSDGLNDYFIMRDDLIPFSFGGNKFRIAVEYFKDMKLSGHDCIISYGNTRSNLNRVIANMSYSLSIPCYIVSPTDDSGERKETFNSIIVKSMKAKLFKCEKNNVAETVEEAINFGLSQGLNPYYINGDKYGRGNEKTGLRAYLAAYKQVIDYQKQNHFSFDYIFHASGTGLTQAGLLIGNYEAKDNARIVGISVARNREIGKAKIKECIASYYGENDSKFYDDNINFIDDYAYGGYGKWNDEIERTIQSVLSLEGIPLDRTYTGKAFWGMKKYVKSKNIENSKILFLHTGGTPLFFEDFNDMRNF